MFKVKRDFKRTILTFLTKPQSLKILFSPLSSRFTFVRSLEIANLARSYVSKGRTIL